VSGTLKSDQKLFATLKPELKSQLDYLVLFRDKLLTHKHGLETMGGGAKFYENLATLRLMLMPFSFSEEAISKIGGIFAGVREYLPTKDQEEENVYEQFGILAEHHSNLPQNYKKEVKSLVGQYGTESPSLEDLARFAALFVLDVLLPLAQEIKGAEGS